MHSSRCCASLQPVDLANATCLRPRHASAPCKCRPTTTTFGRSSCQSLWCGFRRASFSPTFRFTYRPAVRFAAIAAYRRIGLYSGAEPDAPPFSGDLCESFPQSHGLIPERVLLRLLLLACQRSHLGRCCHVEVLIHHMDDRHARDGHKARASAMIDKSLEMCAMVPTHQVRIQTNTAASIGHAVPQTCKSFPKCHW